LVILTTLSLDTQGQNLIGTRVQEFELTDINGNIISSKNTEGKVVVLNFWFIGCKPCLAEMPELNTVYNQYKQNPDVVFASITLDNLKKVNNNLDKYNIKYPIVVDGKETCELFKINGYPTNIVIDKKGNYYLNFTGGFSGIGTLISKSIQQVLDIDE